MSQLLPTCSPCDWPRRRHTLQADWRAGVPLWQWDSETWWETMRELHPAELSSLLEGDLGELGAWGLSQEQVFAYLAPGPGGSEPVRRNKARQVVRRVAAGDPEFLALWRELPPAQRAQHESLAAGVGRAIQGFVDARCAIKMPAHPQWMRNVAAALCDPRWKRAMHHAAPLQRALQAAAAERAAGLPGAAACSKAAAQVASARSALPASDQAAVEALLAHLTTHPPLAAPLERLLAAQRVRDSNLREDLEREITLEAAKEVGAEHAPSLERLWGRLTASEA